MKYYFLGLFSVIALCIALFFHFNYPTGLSHYRMTVTVDTPEGVKTGSAVREVLVSKGPDLICNGCGTSVRVRGEAVVVDLGARGVLFALLRSPQSVDYAYDVFFHAFPLPSEPSGAGGATREGVLYHNSLKTGEAELPPNQYPEFVRFRDLKDPKTVELVAPDNMAASFGEGVKLRGVKIEITDAPITTGIDQWLGWLPDYYDKRLDGRRYTESREIPNTLSSGTFSTGQHDGH